MCTPLKLALFIPGISAIPSRMNQAFMRMSDTIEKASKSEDTLNVEGVEEVVLQNPETEKTEIVLENVEDQSLGRADPTSVVTEEESSEPKNTPNEEVEMVKEVVKQEEAWFRSADPMVVRVIVEETDVTEEESLKPKETKNEEVEVVKEEAEEEVGLRSADPMVVEYLSINVEESDEGDEDAADDDEDEKRDVEDGERDDEDAESDDEDKHLERQGRKFHKKKGTKKHSKKHSRHRRDVGDLEDNVEEVKEDGNVSERVGRTLHKRKSKKKHSKHNKHNKRSVREKRGFPWKRRGVYQQRQRVKAEREAERIRLGLTTQRPTPRRQTAFSSFCCGKK